MTDDLLFGAVCTYVSHVSLILQNVPPDLSQCVFVIEQALSVRALQELVTAASSETVSDLLQRIMSQLIELEISYSYARSICSHSCGLGSL